MGPRLRTGWNIQQNHRWRPLVRTCLKMFVFLKIHLVFISLAAITTERREADRLPQRSVGGDVFAKH